MPLPLPDSTLDQLFRQARTAHGFLPGAPLSDDQIRALYDLAKWPPTAFNGQPARWVFVRGAEAKGRLLPLLSPGNKAQTEAAAATVIVAWDTRFHTQLPVQYPAYDAAPLFEANPALLEATARRNSSLQGAYLMLAARALGLDAGPMSGFDAAAVDAAFFPDGQWKSNFLINLGTGDASKLHPRGPRLPFESVVQVL